MPRQMPQFSSDLRKVVDAAIGIVKAGELTRTFSERARSEWHVARLEHLYELAFLRAFAAWEAVLESVFIRSLCGYTFAAGQELLIAGATFHPTIGTAEAVLMPANHPFMLWHSPKQVIQRYDKHFQYAHPAPAIQRTVIASAYAHLDGLSRIRHRIVHNQADARAHFDATSALLAGRTYPGSRPGRFLRDIDPTNAPRRWLETTTDDLVNIASQLA